MAPPAAPPSDDVAKKVSRYRDGLVSETTQLNQTAVFSTQKLLQESPQEAVPALVAKDVPRLLCDLLFQGHHKPETRQCAIGCLAALASQAESSASFIIDSLSKFANTDSCDKHCREHIMCVYCNLSRDDSRHEQLINVGGRVGGGSTD